MVGHTLTVPTQVVGYTLILESEEGEVYTYYITGTNLEFPQELSGNYQISISNGNSMYHSTIELKTIKIRINVDRCNGKILQDA